MKPTFILIALLASSVVSLGDWLEYQKSQIEAVGEEPSISQLEMLAQLVSNDTDSERKATAHELALQKLKSIPDFPERIRDHIIQKREAWRTREILLADYTSARKLFGPLGGVPDPRIVGTLGEFLYDNEWPTDKSLEAELNNLYPNSVLAMRALGRLVETPVIQGEPRSYKLDDVATWQLWYEQVKAGNRTFRFKGDPQEYSLAGPVSEAREPKTDRPPIANEAASPVEAESKSTSLPILPLTLAGVLLAVAIWFTTKRKPAAP